MKVPFNPGYYYYNYGICTGASISCPQSYFPSCNIASDADETDATLPPNYPYYNSTNCGHRCCYEQYLRQRQKEFEQFYCSAQVQQREHEANKNNCEQSQVGNTTSAPPPTAIATTAAPGTKPKPIKIDKATDTSTDMNPPDSPPSMASSASPPPAPPPLPISVRAAYCARCRFNIEHSRHDLSSSQSHLLNVGNGTGSAPANNYGIPRNSYAGYNVQQNRGLADEEDSVYPALLEREFHSLHRNVPGLRRAGVDTNAIRQHFYPDGGWGWIVCGVAFLAHVLTTGFQLSYGLLLLYAMRHLGHQADVEAGWLGAASWATSLFTSSIVVAFCRRKSTRLTAVLGGLVLALGILFTSFATQLHQIAFSYGIIVGFGASLVRESSSVMIGHYFKRRRQFVEMITMSGEGVGVALFSVILKEGVGKMGWRLGLQSVTVLVSMSFFMGLLYRPASLYHPQRRAIQHLKNQRKKVKEKKTHIRTPKPPFMDFSPLKSTSVQMMSLSAAMAAYGIYTPIFFMSLHGYQEGYDMQDLVLIQTFIGLSIAIGIVAGGSAINKTCQFINYKKIRISRQYVCQGCVILSAVSMLFLSGISEHHYFCLVAWSYGLSLGGYKYSLKMLALERIRGKHFTKAWGFIKGAESLPVVIGVPLTAYLNEASHKYGRAGYYICSAFALISGILMFFIGHLEERKNVSKYSTNGSIMSRCTQPSTATTTTDTCPHGLSRSYSLNRRRQNWPTSSPYPANAYQQGYYLQQQQQPMMYNDGCGRPGRLQKSYSFAFQTPHAMMNANELNYQPASCHGSQSACNTIDRRYSRCELHRQHQQQQQQLQHHQTFYPFTYYQTNGTLHARSRSVPEGLGNGHHFDYSSLYNNKGAQQQYCQWINGSNYWQQQQQQANIRPQVHVVEQMTTSV
ncbi:uncharacterized protein LOC134832336 [Culicoides brevitarsis]|uniref:uncharacterized protein LOC134832336 n=1 Tax=Culicoides brevitarsis TaxID=469753 RepID=UPI00307B1AD9